jgi:hypothetical protein
MRRRPSRAGFRFRWVVVLACSIRVALAVAGSEFDRDNVLAGSWFLAIR